MGETMTIEHNDNEQVNPSDDEMIDELMQGPSNLSTLKDVNISTVPKVILTADEAVALMASLPFCCT